MLAALFNGAASGWDVVEGKVRGGSKKIVVSIERCRKSIAVLVISKIFVVIITDWPYAFTNLRLFDYMDALR